MKFKACSYNTLIVRKMCSPIQCTPHSSAGIVELLDDGCVIKRVPVRTKLPTLWQFFLGDSSDTADRNERREVAIHELINEFIENASTDTFVRLLRVQWRSAHVELTLERATRGSLDTFLPEAGAPLITAFPRAVAVSIALRVLLAVYHLRWRLGVAHNDLHEGNVLMSDTCFGTSEYVFWDASTNSMTHFQVPTFGLRVMVADFGGADICAPVPRGSKATPTNDLGACLGLWYGRDSSQFCAARHIPQHCTDLLQIAAVLHEWYSWLADTPRPAPLQTFHMTSDKPHVHEGRRAIMRVAAWWRGRI